MLFATHTHSSTKHQPAYTLSIGFLTKLHNGNDNTYKFSNNEFDFMVSRRKWRDKRTCNTMEIQTKIPSI